MTNPVAKMLVLNQMKIEESVESSGIGISSSFALPGNFTEISNPDTEFLLKFTGYLKAGLDEFLEKMTELHAIPMENSMVVGSSGIISALITDFLQKVYADAGDKLGPANIIHIVLFFTNNDPEIRVNLAFTTGITTDEQSPAAMVRAVITVAHKTTGLANILTTHVPGNTTVH